MTASRTPSMVVRSALLAALILGLLAPAAKGQPVRTATRQPTPTELRDQMLALINRARATRGLASLSLNGRLSGEALGHSRAMAREQRLFHTPGLVVLIGSAGGSVYGENLGKGRGLRGIRDAWLRHGDTRGILLDGRFRHAGLGVVHAAGFYWVTLQAFD